MYKSAQQKSSATKLKLHSKVSAKLEDYYPCLIGALHTLLVHSIHTPEYLQTVKDIYYFICDNVENKSELPQETKKLIVKSLSEAFLEATNEVCMIINMHRVGLLGLGINSKKFEPLFDFLTSEINYKFSDIQCKVNGRYFIERIDPSRTKYKNYCIKKCKIKDNIQYIHTNPELKYFFYEHLANLSFLILTGREIKDEDIRKIFDSPKNLSIVSASMEKERLEMILTEAINLHSLTESQKEFQVFVGMVNQSPYAKDYPLLFKIKTALLNEHFREMTLLGYSTSDRLEILKELMIDIKDTMSKVPFTSQVLLEEQPVFVAQVDQHDIAIKNKSNEIARKIHQIFQKNKEHANEQICHKIIPSWFIEGHKYTSASFEVVEVWDNIYAIIYPGLLSSMRGAI